MKLGVMIEYFENGLSINDHLWQKVASEATYLNKLHISAVWLPPAFKGASGIYDTGYGVYDLYDLGEFYQKWTVSTKYGYLDEYIYAINTLQNLNIDVYADIVLNHKMGADEFEEVESYQVSNHNRYNHIKKLNLKAATKFYFPGRDRYSPFIWNHEHFNGIDYFNRIYRFSNHQWNEYVDKENYNYDFLMGANIDYNNQDVRMEMKYFINWYQNKVHFNGVRIDASKHIDYTFLNDLFKNKDYFKVCEYWHGSIDVLNEYLYHTDYRFHLFDVPLHYHFYECSKYKDNYDMRNLFKDTLVVNHPTLAVTFVDNHDTCSHSDLSSFIPKWFKPFAYACILLRNTGYPCIFYGDLYGLKNQRYNGIRTTLEKLLILRQKYCDHDYIDYISYNYLGFSYDSGLAVLFSLREDAYVYMYVGINHHNKVMKDIFSKNNTTIIDDYGYACIKATKEKLAVYVVRD